MLLATLALTAGASRSPIYDTAYGQIKCKSVAGGTVHACLNVPSAQPPLGSLRWRAAVPPIPWTGVRAADDLTTRSSCYQAQNITYAEPQFDVDFGLVSEDCLYFDIFIPVDGYNLDTIQVTYGGGLVSGSKNFFYNGAIKIAAHYDVIVLMGNYRHSAFANVYHSSLGLGNDNLSLRDVFSLRDYYDLNAVYFGGNPNRVHLVGHSSGATMALVAGVLADKTRTYPQWVSVTALEPALFVANDRDAVAAAFLKKIGNLSFAQAQLLPASQILDTSVDGQTFYLTYGPDLLLTKQPLALVQDGNFDTRIKYLGYNPGAPGGSIGVLRFPNQCATLQITCVMPLLMVSTLVVYLLMQLWPVKLLQFIAPIRRASFVITEMRLSNSLLLDSVPILGI